MGNYSIEELEQNISLCSFLDQVEEKLSSKLEKEMGKKGRFVGGEKLLINRFRKRRLSWEKAGLKIINEVIETVNEICVAHKILFDTTNRCIKLQYEPIPVNNKQSIDFRATFEDGRCIYCDVKTIHPGSQDDWDNFVSIRKNKRFPSNVNVTLFKDGLGGEIWHKMYNSRQSMIVYSLELEEKISNYVVGDNTYFVMTFCGNGTDWGEDDLEDFVDFYRTGHYNLDDPFSQMERFSIEKDNIKLLRNIHGFCYLERPVAFPLPATFKCDIKSRWYK